MALSYHSNMDPLPASSDSQLILTDSLIGFVYEQLQAPDFTIAPFLNPEPRTHHSAAPKPAQVPTLNPSPLTAPCIPSQHQDSYRTNAQQSCHANKPAQVPTLNPSPLTAPCIPSQHQDSYRTNAQQSCHANAEFTPSPIVKYHQTCNNHFSTASLTNQVNILYQNPSFPVRSCTHTRQGRVPAFKCASAQSVSARVRRKKISDKTQELAKLIPGGNRMNTAEMLLAAFKYVRFLQAQIGILAMMDSKEAREVPLMVEDYMRVLLGSTNVQDNLSAQGKCLVPKKLAMNLTKEMKSNVVVSRDLSHFLESINN